MKNILTYFTIFVGIAAHCFAITVELEGAPQGGEDVADAPIYTLDGTARATLEVGETSCAQDLTFTMDNVNSGKVRTTGAMHLTEIDGSWDAWFDANSFYVINKYEDLITVTFNHTLKKDSEEDCIIEGQIADKGYITSKGYMNLLGDYTFIGQMAGKVVASKSRRTIVNFNYNEAFTQEFSNIVAEDQGVWSASYTFNEGVTKKGMPSGVLTGTGTIVVGPQGDPVDTVDQNVKGTKKGGVYSWTTTSKSRLDGKVKVKIKHTDTDLVDDARDPNYVSAAAQTRKF